jgi:hypothetical protein
MKGNFYNYHFLPLEVRNEKKISSSLSFSVCCTLISPHLMLLPMMFFFYISPLLRSSEKLFFFLMKMAYFLFKSLLSTRHRSSTRAAVSFIFFWRMKFLLIFFTFWFQSVFDEKETQKMNEKKMFLISPKQLMISISSLNIIYFFMNEWLLFEWTRTSWNATKRQRKYNDDLREIHTI